MRAGSTRARTTTRWSRAGCAIELRLTTDLNLAIEGPRTTARHLIKEGELLFCALAWSEHPAPRTYEEAYRRVVWTAHHWQHWIERASSRITPGARSCSAALSPSRESPTRATAQEKVFGELADDIADRIRGRQEELREALLRRMAELIPATDDLRAVATAYGIVTDKALLAAGKPTRIRGTLSPFRPTPRPNSS